MDTEAFAQAHYQTSPEAFLACRAKMQLHAGQPGLGFNTFVFTPARVLEAEASLRLSGPQRYEIEGTSFSLQLMGLMPLYDGDDNMRLRGAFLHYEPRSYAGTKLNSGYSAHAAHHLINALPPPLVKDERWSTTALLLVALQDDLEGVQQVLAREFAAFPLPHQVTLRTGG